MTVVIELELSDQEVAREAALGIIGRAQELNDNPTDDYQDVAEELRDEGQNLYKEYE